MREAVKEITAHLNRDPPPIKNLSTNLHRTLSKYDHFSLLIYVTW